MLHTDVFVLESLCFVLCRGKHAVESWSNVQLIRSSRWPRNLGGPLQRGVELLLQLREGCPRAFECRTCRAVLVRDEGQQQMLDVNALMLKATGDALRIA